MKKGASLREKGKQGASPRGKEGASLDHTRGGKGSKPRMGEGSISEGKEGTPWALVSGSQCWIKPLPAPPSSPELRCLRVSPPRYLQGQLISQEGTDEVEEVSAQPSQQEIDGESLVHDARPAGLVKLPAEHWAQTSPSAGSALPGSHPQDSCGSQSSHGRKITHAPLAPGGTPEPHRCSPSALWEEQDDPSCRILPSGCDRTVTPHVPLCHPCVSTSSTPGLLGTFLLQCDLSCGPARA